MKPISNKVFRLTSLLLSRGFMTRLGYLLRHMVDRSRVTSKLRRTLSFPKKKERYPIYIVQSDCQYRENRSMVLSALIGKNFRTLRGHRQLSLEQVAEEIGIPADILHQLESGTLEVTPSLLVVISNYFGVVIDYLLYQDLSIEQ